MRGWILLLAAAVLGGSLFLFEVGRLWPVAQPVMRSCSDKDMALAAAAVVWTGHSVIGAPSAQRLELDDPALRWLEHQMGEALIQMRPGRVSPWSREIQWRWPGRPEVASVWVHPAGGLAGWLLRLEDDEALPSLDSAAAESLVVGRLKIAFGFDLADWVNHNRQILTKDARTDRKYVWKRPSPWGHGVEERLEATVSGRTVSAARWTIHVPAEWSRVERTRNAREEFARSIGLAILGLAGAGAFVLAFLALREGRSGSLQAPLAMAGCVLAILSLVRALRTYRLFDNWDPLGARWMSDLKLLFQGLLADLAAAALILGYLVGTRYLDQKREAGLGEFFLLRWSAVKDHAARGFLLGWITGGVLVVGAALTTYLGGGQVGAQPRGFLLFGINSAAPWVVVALYFLQIALIEELAWRRFLLEALVALRIPVFVAVAIQAIGFGLVHSGLDFLPPVDPWWGRILTMTGVGLVWGWAYLRWGIATVFFAHWACDLFVFGWPFLSGGLGLWSLGWLALPLVPLLPFPVARILSRGQT